MAQLKSQYDEVRVPFNKMSFTPDVPSTALGPTEYNVGYNVETDVRGIRSVAGDQEILNTIPGTPTFVTGGFRQNDTFWFIVACTEGKWYASSSTQTWYEITPVGGPISGYTQATNITSAWNGTIPLFNDTIGAPMFLPDSPGAILTQYSQQLPVSINTITYIDIVTQQITFQTPYAATPYIAGQQIIITGVNSFFNGKYVVVSCTTTTVNYTASPGGTYPGGEIGTVSPAYTWNYNPNWLSVTTNFMRMYSTPNVGSILVAGNLSAVPITNPSTTITYPVTVQWSQAFGLNDVPLTWTPTITNVSNQLEVPLRGPALDAFPSNGQFFLCSYWDTVVFSPLNYTTTSAPILGVRLYNQGRGLLSSNCWANADDKVYGIDARDVWVFDGTNFTGIGNQRIKNWLFDQLSPQYFDRVYMQTNTEKNQIEIYYPDSSAIDGVPNKMLSYRYDLDVWNSPREVSNATMSCESPVYVYTSSWSPNFGSRTVVYARGVYGSKLIQTNIGYSHNDGSPIHSYFRRDNIKLLPNYSGKLMIHRALPETVNLGAIPFTGTNNIQITPSTGTISLKIEGTDSVGSSPTETTDITMNLDTNNPWCQVDQNTHRVNSVVMENTSNTNVWMTSAITFQYTQTEDDR